MSSLRMGGIGFIGMRRGGRWGGCWIGRGGEGWGRLLLAEWEWRMGRMRETMYG